jgi:hypothetical protein
MLEVARKELGEAYERCDLRLGDAVALPYVDGTFDLVVCFRFFGLISFSMAHDVLREIHRVSRGATIIRVPVRAEPAAKKGRPRDHGSVQGQMVESELREMFAEHGFMICDTRLIEERDGVNYNVYVLRKSADGRRSERH